MLISLEEGGADDNLQTILAKDAEKNKKASALLLERLKEQMRTKLEDLKRKQGHELDHQKAKSALAIKNLDAELSKLIGDHETSLLDKFADEFTQIKSYNDKLTRDPDLSAQEREELEKKLRELAESLEARLKKERDAFNNGLLAQKMAERKAKVAQLAEEERAIRRKHVDQKLALIDANEEEQLPEKQKLKDQQLQGMIKEFEEKLPVNERALALQAYLNDTHNDEMNDLLSKQFDEKADQLKDEILALLEEKIAMQRHIQDERRAKMNVLDFLEE